MKKRDVEIGREYVVKVSGRLTRVRLNSESPYGGWTGTNTSTGREVRIKTAARLRYQARYVTPPGVPDVAVYGAP